MGQWARCDTDAGPTGDQPDITLGRDLQAFVDTIKEFLDQLSVGRPHPAAPEFAKRAYHSARKCCQRGSRAGRLVSFPRVARMVSPRTKGPEGIPEALFHPTSLLGRSDPLPCCRGEGYVPSSLGATTTVQGAGRSATPPLRQVCQNKRRASALQLWDLLIND
jgi:hypothetical protein